MKELFHWRRNRRYRLPFAAALIHARHNALLLVLNWNVNFGNWATGPESLPCSFLIFHLAEVVCFDGDELTLNSPCVTTPWSQQVKTEGSQTKSACQNGAPSYKSWKVGGKGQTLKYTVSYPGSSHYWPWRRGGKSNFFRTGDVSSAGQQKWMHQQAWQNYMMGIKQ